MIAAITLLFNDQEAEILVVNTDLIDESDPYNAKVKKCILGKQEFYQIDGMAFPTEDGYVNDTALISTKKVTKNTGIERLLIIQVYYDW